MKLYILAVFLFVTLVAQAQSSYPAVTIISEDYMNRTDARGLKQGYWQYHPENENVMLEANFRNDTLQGECKVYDSRGKLLQKCSYLDGRLNGYFQKFWPDGKVMEEGTYDEGTLTGIYRTYWPCGKIKSLSVYISGELDGICEEYDPNGRLRVSSGFKEGIKTGKESIYDKHGKKPVVENYFRNGRRNLTVIRDSKGGIMEVITGDQNPVASTNYQEALKR